jgi:hypothetical protein
MSQATETFTFSRQKYQDIEVTPWPHDMAGFHEPREVAALFADDALAMALVLSERDAIWCIEPWTRRAWPVEDLGTLGELLGGDATLIAGALAAAARLAA